MNGESRISKVLYAVFPCKVQDDERAAHRLRCYRRSRHHLLLHASALWSGTNKERHVSTGPLARPFACSLAPLTRSLALDCSLCSHPPLRSLIRSLAHFAHSLARGKFLMSQNDMVLSHSELGLRVHCAMGHNRKKTQTK